MLLSSVLAVTVFTMFSSSVESAQVLAVFPSQSLSHQVVFNAFIKSLARNGHKITMVTAGPIKLNVDLENVTQIDLHASYKLFLENVDITNTKLSSKGDVTAMISVYYNAIVHVMERQFNTPAIKNLIQEPGTHKFDLFIGEHLHPNIFAFAELYKVPSIGINSMTAMRQQFKLIGNPVHPFLFSHMFSENVGLDLHFWEKLTSLYYAWKTDYEMYTLHYPRLDTFTKKHFGPNTKNITELTAEVDMFFVNADSLFTGVRPTVPSLVWLGNMHFKADRLLPEDLQSYLDASKNGVVYMSLGSNVKSNKLPEDRRRVFVETFRDLPYSILWKWEDENLPDRPDNVRVSKWLPQNDVLRHPKVKLFITQSGLQSTEEAIKYKVPMLGIPFIADQFFNSKRLEQFQIGLQLDIMTVTKEQLRAAVILIMENKSYTENIAKLSRLMHDQPMKPVDHAVWWTEYVVRHQGAPHLRSPLLHVSFIEYYMLDVLSILLAGLLTALVTVYYIVRLSLRQAIALFSGDENSKVN